QHRNPAACRGQRGAQYVQFFIRTQRAVFAHHAHHHDAAHATVDQALDSFLDRIEIERAISLHLRGHCREYTGPIKFQSHPPWLIAGPRLCQGIVYVRDSRAKSISFSAERPSSTRVPSCFVTTVSSTSTRFAGLTSTTVTVVVSVSPICTGARKLSSCPR